MEAGAHATYIKLWAIRGPNFRKHRRRRPGRENRFGLTFIGQTVGRYHCVQHYRGRVGSAPSSYGIQIDEQWK